MIKRYIYRAYLNQDKIEEFDTCLNNYRNSINEIIKKNNLATISIFKYHKSLFVYYETINGFVLPNIILEKIDSCLLDIPGENGDRKWVRMYDIFHYVPDLDVDTWLEKRGKPYPTLQIIRLKPEMLSSYIFYHFQLQEELRGERSKYGMIALNENTIVMYGEEPGVSIDPHIDGKLETQNTPDKWHELMEKHFLPVDESDDCWYPTKLLISCFI